MSIVLYKRTKYKGRYTAEAHSSAYKTPYSMKDIRTEKLEIWNMVRVRTPIGLTVYSGLVLFENIYIQE